MSLRRSLAAVGTAAFVAAGCAMPDDKLAQVLVAPNKFALYRCEDLAVRGKELVAREAELKALMAQAGTGSGGQLVSAMAYRPEHLSVQGELMELRREAAEKKCGSMPGSDAAASVNAPVAPPPANRPQAPAR